MAQLMPWLACIALLPLTDQWMDASTIDSDNLACICRTDRTIDILILWVINPDEDKHEVCFSERGHALVRKYTRCTLIVLVREGIILSIFDSSPSLTEVYQPYLNWPAVDTQVTNLSSRCGVLYRDAVPLGTREGDTNFVGENRHLTCRKSGRGL